VFRLKERKVKILFIIMRKATFQKVAFFIFNCKVRDIRRAVPSLFTLRRAGREAIAERRTLRTAGSKFIHSSQSLVRVRNSHQPKRYLTLGRAG
jgi:hypothetical protein